MEDLVSVIMPTYNSGTTLQRSVESILNQTYTNIELLITDDCSKDNTAELIRRISEKDSRVRSTLLTSNFGPGYARNEAIGRAKGRYIAFCDSDDRWFPDKLEKQIAFMNEKRCALSYTSYLVCDENDNDVGIVIAPEKIDLTMLKRDNKIGCLTAVYDTKLLGQKYYMPTLRKRQDWALFLTILKSCDVAYGITDPLAYYRDMSGSISSNKFSLVKYNVRVYQQILGYSKMKSYCYFLFCFFPSYSLKVLKNKVNSIKYVAKLKEMKKKNG